MKTHYQQEKNENDEKFSVLMNKLNVCAVEKTPAPFEPTVHTNGSLEIATFSMARCETRTTRECTMLEIIGYLLAVF